MAKPTALNRLFAALASSDATEVRAGIERIGERLRQGGLGRAHLDRIAEAMGSLVRHPSSAVRQDLARELVALRHNQYHAILARLLEDENQWVRNEARRTQARRSEQAQISALPEEHRSALSESLAAIEQRHGPAARQSVLRIAERYVEMVVSVARHEINGPLTVSLSDVSEAMNVLERRPSRASQRRLAVTKLAEARDSLRHIDAILDSLGTFSRSVAPTMEREPLRDLITQAVSLAAGEKKPTGLRVELDVSDALTVPMHRERMLEVLSNLIRNAFDALAGRPDPRVRIDTKVAEGVATIRIEDNGCGIAEDDLEKLFVLFASRKPGGTGVGLALARRIVEDEHQGSIRLESSAGIGTTAIVALPLERED